MRLNLPFFELVSGDLVHLLHGLVQCSAYTICPFRLHLRCKGTDALLASGDMAVNQLYRLVQQKFISIKACSDELCFEEAIRV